MCPIWGGQVQSSDLGQRRPVPFACPDVLYRSECSAVALDSALFPEVVQLAFWIRLCLERVGLIVPFSFPHIPLGPFFKTQSQGLRPRLAAICEKGSCFVLFCFSGWRRQKLLNSSVMGLISSKKKCHEFGRGAGRWNLFTCEFWITKPNYKSHSACFFFFLKEQISSLCGR